MQETQTVMPPAVSPSASAPQRYDFRFTGKAGEYFRIWIVNLALSILTLGIYSAWAKVRTARYFYANTLVAGSPFEYLGQPLAVLRGRLVAAAVGGLYVFLSKAAPTWVALYIAVLWLATPFLVVMALRFRLRVSSWRGVRFAFDGRFGEAARYYLLWPLALPFTLGLLFPYIQYRQKAFLVDRARFGDTPFQHRFGPKPFYWLYLKLSGLFLLILLAAMVVIVGTVFSATRHGQLPSSMASFVTFLPMLTIMPLYLLTFCYALVRLHNLVWNNTQLGEHRFESRLSVRKMLWLYVSNAVAMIGTLGLAYPWAKIRLFSYRVACTTLIAADSLESFHQGTDTASSAIGDQVSNVLDLDLGL
jgi:uncharacterized membrane protein YjgN (DUF898 family)